MFPFLFIFIVFVLVLNYFLRKNKKKEARDDDAFWEREREANFTRKQDISGLDYVHIPPELIPQNLHTESEAELVDLVDCRILNLTGESNTDLKLKYGVANLDALTICDDNFSRFVSSAATYSQELYDDGQVDAAQKLLEFAVDSRADSRAIYLLLAKIYSENGESEKISGLIDSADALDSFSGRIISGKLKELSA